METDKTSVLCRQYTIDNIEGAEESFSVVVTDDMMQSFRMITSDENPLHTDAEYAGKCGYTDKVVYGLLTGSFLSALCGMYMPGERSLIQQVNIRFSKPVYIGDSLTVRGRVKEVHKSVDQVLLDVSIINQDNENVLWGGVKVGIIK